MKTRALLNFFCILPTIAISQWVQTTGPSGGAVGTFSSDYPYIFLSAGYRSTNSGASWEEFLSAYCFIKNLDNLLAFTTKGILRSSNNGINWDTIAFSGKQVQRAIKINNLLFANVLQEGPTFLSSLFRSSDEGFTWKLINSSALLCGAIDTKLFVAYPRDGIYYTTDYGESWVEANNGISIRSPQYPEIVVTGFTTDDKDICVSTFWSNSLDSIYYSTDRGITWVNKGFVEGGLQALLLNGNILFAATRERGILKSIDQGETWNQINAGLFGTDVSALFVFDRKLFASTKFSGIYWSSNDGASWVPSNTGLIRSNIAALTSHRDQLFAGTVCDGIYYTNDGGQTWFRSNPVSNSYTSLPAMISVDTDLIAVILDKVYRTSDGKSWIKLSDHIGNGVVNQSSLVYDGNSLFAANNAGVFRSLDRGLTWTNITGELLYYSNLSLCKSQVLVSALGGVFQFDGNNSWKLKGLPPGRFIGSNEEYLFATEYDTAHGPIPLISRKIYHSSDLGLTWELVDTLNARIEFLISKDEKVFAVTDSGVFSANANGSEWIPLDSFPQKMGIRTLAVHRNELFAGSFGRGVWRYALTPDTADNPGNKDELFITNYPNPFIDQTRIQFSVDLPRTIGIRIHDILGNEIASLVNGAFDPGIYVVDWRPISYPAGIYTCHLFSSDGPLRTILLIKQ